MPVLTPSFVFDFESQMKAIVEDEYARMSQNLWWQSITRVIPSASRKEVIAWLLSTATIKPQGLGGNINFEDVMALSTEYVAQNSGEGLSLKRDQLEDADGKGLEYASKWAADIGRYMAYWPQRKVAEAILDGTRGKAYDGVTFFSSTPTGAGSHPYNPLVPSLGGFANRFTGAASGAYPGASPIDDSVSVDQAVINLSKIFAYIASIKMPNGQDPRFLVPRKLFVPPRMVPRVQQLTKAKFIAQAAASGGGSGDIEAIISNWGMAEPQEVPEFGAGQSYVISDGQDAGGVIRAQATVSGSDTTCYLAVEQLTSSQLGGMVYVDREPFKITYYTGQGGGTGMDAILDRARELEWHCLGRNATSFGHPYLLFRLDQT